MAHRFSPEDAAKSLATRRDPARFARIFWTKVEIVGECWEWRGARQRRQDGSLGYGRVYDVRLGKQVYAHRSAYELTYGSLPDDALVLHHCDNPPCVRPSHLYAGSHSDNIADAWHRDRRFTAKRQFCRKGHYMTGENVYTYPNGDRRCAVCMHDGYVSRLGKPVGDDFYVAADGSSLR